MKQMLGVICCNTTHAKFHWFTHNGLEQGILSSPSLPRPRCIWWTATIIVDSALLLTCHCKDRIAIACSSLLKFVCVMAMLIGALVLWIYNAIYSDWEAIYERIVELRRAGFSIEDIGAGVPFLARVLPTFYVVFSIYTMLAAFAFADKLERASGNEDHHQKVVTLKV